MNNELALRFEKETGKKAYCSINGLTGLIRFPEDDYVLWLESQIPKWISVKERLPGKGEIVDIYCDRLKKRLSDMEFIGNGYFRRGAVYKAILDNTITHWRPKPSPPGE